MDDGRDEKLVIKMVLLMVVKLEVMKVCWKDLIMVYLLGEIEVV
jgi:hypothetical protein